MHTTTSSIAPPESFAELIEVAQREKWCVRLGCTTCGALPFRKALRQIPRVDVIAGLRDMSQRFLAENSEMFRLIIWETSAFGYGGELLEPLAGTQAAKQLQANIDYQNRNDEKRRAYAASQTPEAIAERRAKKKIDAVLATAPHRDRKLANQDIIRAVADELAKTPTSQILTVLATREYDVPHAAIGGLVYKRLAGYYRAQRIAPRDLTFLSKLAAVHAGHWKKLVDRLVSP